MQGLMLMYATVVLLVLLLAVSAARNFPTGLCIFGTCLNVMLVFFFLLPLFYTAALIVTRDGCHNAEDMLLAAAGRVSFPNATNATLTAAKPSSSSSSNGTGVNPAQALMTYYLQGGITVESALKAVFGFDVREMKAGINKTVEDAIGNIKQEINPRVKVRPMSVLGDDSNCNWLKLQLAPGFLCFLVHKSTVQTSLFVIVIFYPGAPIGAQLWKHWNPSGIVTTINSGIPGFLQKSMGVPPLWRAHLCKA
jgi:hypothetical protein